MSKKSLSDIMSMSKEEIRQSGREFVYVATKKGECSSIRDALKSFGEKVYVAESGKVLVKAPNGEEVKFPVYFQYKNDSGMWEATTVKPNAPEDMFVTDAQLTQNILLAAAILYPIGVLRAVFGC